MLRDYTPADYTACLAIMDSNFPDFFSQQERVEFLTFLKEPIGWYSVLEDNQGHIIGCGGIAQENSDTGILKWGMIRRDHHRQGWGSILTRARLKQLENMLAIKQIILHTSNESFEFYEKLGFRVTKFTRDFYRPGLHRYDMTRDVIRNPHHEQPDIDANLLYLRYDHVTI